MSDEDSPDWWIKAPLSQLTLKLVDGSHNPPKKQESGLPMLSAVNIYNNCVNFTAYRVIAPSDFAREHQRTMIQQGDVLLTIVGAIGRSAVVKAASLPFTLQRSVAVLTPAAIDSRFLMYQLESPRIANFFISNARGTAQKGVYLKTLGSTEVWFPSLAEQQRIVAKIEELLSELDQGVESLKSAKVQLAVYRQAVLKHAFEGKLTAQWREENKEKLETPEKLASRFQHARKTLYEEQLKDWKQAVEDWSANGEEGRKPSKPKSPPEVAPVNSSEALLPTVPDGWSWLHLGQVAYVSGGLTKNQKRTGLPRKMKYLRVANVYAHQVITNEIHEIGVTDEEARNLKLRSGDLLIVEGNGSIDQIGRVAIWSDEVPDCGHQNHLIRARLPADCDPLFVLYFLLSPVGRDLIVKEASSTSGLHTLSISKVSNLAIPCASPEEVAVVLDEIDEKLSKVNKCLQEIDAELLRANVLRQAVLAKAFSGGLVSQDANDEPASVLFERIKAEREERAADRNKSKKRKRRKDAA